MCSQINHSDVHFLLCEHFIQHTKIAHMDEVFSAAIKSLEATRAFPIQSAEASHPTMIALSRVICYSSKDSNKPYTHEEEKQWQHRALIARARRHIEAVEATLSIPPGTKCINGMDPISHCELAIEDCERVLNELADDDCESKVAFYGSCCEQLRYDSHCLRVKAAHLGVPHLLDGYLKSALERYPTHSFFKKLHQQNPQRIADDKKRERHIDPTAIKDVSNEDYKSSVTESIPDSLMCSICQRIFLDPLTTACGHTFCRGCLLECLDHASERGWSCPLCRGPIHLNAISHPVSTSVSGLIEHLFPRALTNRLQEEREASLSANSSCNSVVTTLPLFVVGAIPPGVRVKLNIFEPRYRLMFRRCLQGSRCFGVLAHSRQGTTNWGTECRILESCTQPDGQILISCEGIRRFRVVSTSPLDGYLMGSVQPYSDNFDNSVHFSSSIMEADQELRFMESALRPILLRLQAVARTGLINLDGVSSKLLSIPEYPEKSNLALEEAKERHERIEGVSLLLAGHVDVADEHIQTDDTMQRVKALQSKNWLQ